MIKFITLFLASLMITSSVISQVKYPPIKPGSITRVTKFKPPVVKTFLGRNTNNAEVTSQEADQLLSLPLKIADAKNITYTITSYQFMYKKKSVIENEETGRKETVFTTVADLFKTTPLPVIWVSNIAGGFQKDEELFFFDVIVTDKLKRKFFAPDLKLRIK
ncbi:MAG: hypothetical protein ABJA57_05830 [Ginsengibacter sp.]